MGVNFESLLKSNLDNYFDDIFTGIPAIIVGIQQIEDGLVDVQPLVNNLFPDGTKVEFPVLYSVPIMMPSTSTTSITMPVNHGDSVWLMFSQRDIDVYKNGGDTPHDPSSFRKFNMNDAVALIGLNPVNKSKLSKNAHKSKFDNDSLVIAHNIGTERESSMIFRNSGDVEIDAKANLSITAKNISVASQNLDIKCSAISIQSSQVDIKSIVMINGMNLNQFMLAHIHPYTDDGRPMQTAPAIGY